MRPPVRLGLRPNAGQFALLVGLNALVGGMVGLDVDGVTDRARDFDGLYFETGQGSEVTNGAAEGIDMVTLEART